MIVNWQMRVEDDIEQFPLAFMVFVEAAAAQSGPLRRRLAIQLLDAPQEELDTHRRDIPSKCGVYSARSSKQSWALAVKFRSIYVFAFLRGARSAPSKRNVSQA